ncbi:hypothetical protein ES703_95114 [subsurface metagenome]
MSDGRLVVESFVGGSIVARSKEFEGLIGGTIESAQSAIAWAMSFTPAAAVLSIGIAGEMTPIQYRLWYEVGGGRELYARVMEPLGIVPVGGLFVLEPPEVWAFSTVPIESLADIKGLKIRLGNPGQREIFSRMGASTVFLPGDEIYESLSRGVIDAAEYLSLSLNWPVGFHEVADYLYLSPTRFPAGGSGFYVSKNAWEKLTPDLQLIVEKAAVCEPVRSYAEAIVREEEALQNFIDYGTKVRNIPKEIDDELVRVSTAYFDEQAAAEEPLYAEILESRRAFKQLCESQDIR